VPKLIVEPVSEFSEEFRVHGYASTLLDLGFGRKKSFLALAFLEYPEARSHKLAGRCVLARRKLVLDIIFEFLGERYIHKYTLIMSE
jgi:hypothetical protein